MENHSLHRHFWLQNLIEVPRDGFAFAVLISCQVQLIGFLECAAQFRNPLLLVRVDLVIGFETVFHIHGKPGVWAVLHVLRQLGGRGKVTNVPNRGLHLVIIPQVTTNCLGLRRRLYDYQLHCNYAPFYCWVLP